MALSENEAIEICVNFIIRFFNHYPTRVDMISNERFLEVQGIAENYPGMANVFEYLPHYAVEEPAKFREQLGAWYCALLIRDHQGIDLYSHTFCSRLYAPLTAFIALIGTMQLNSLCLQTLREQEKKRIEEDIRNSSAAPRSTA